MKAVSRSLPKAHVLVVDDEAPILEWLRELLSRAGFEVSAAGDGAEALERFQVQKTDIVVTDILMEGMDGYTLCREIKQRSPHEFIPVIFMTALPDIEKGLDCGADEYLIKPVRSEEVIARIHS